LIIAVIVASGLAIGMFGFYTMSAEDYYVAVGNYTNSSDYSYVTVVNSTIASKLDTLQNKTLGLGQKVQTGIALLDAVIIGASLLVDVSSTLFEIPKIIINFMTGTQRLAGIVIPSFFMATISLVIIVIFIFTVLKMVFKVDV